MNAHPAAIGFTEEVRDKIRAGWTPERRKAQSARSSLDLSGQRFGRLVAVRRVERGQTGWLWECRCDCGSEKTALAASLRSGSVKSCGCLWREVMTAPRPERRGRPYQHLLTRLRYRCRQKDIEFGLSYVDLLAFVEQQECFYCGAGVVWEPHQGRGIRARTNLDRKDNRLGYVPENLVVCCWACNDGKGDRYTFEEWQAMAAALREVRARG